MKFLILSQNSGSRKHGMVMRNYNWARALTQMGHEVTVVGSSFSHSRQAQPQTKGRVTEENIDGIRYLWLWGPKYGAKNALGRVMSMFVFCLQLFLPDKRLRGSYDVVIASSPPPFVIYPAHWRAKKMKAKLIFDARDLWPLTLKELGGYSERHPFIWLMQKSEDYACRHADLVTAVAQNSETYLQSRGLAKGRFMPMGNGLLSAKGNGPADLLPQSLLDKLSDIRKQARLVVGYAGAIGLANAMDTLIHSAAEVESDIHIILFGGGPETEPLKSLSKQLGLMDRVHFMGTVSPEQVSLCLECFDIAYVGLLKRDLYKYGASLTKLNDYMQAGKPIIYAAEDIGNAVEKSGCGIACSAENSESVTKTIKRMSEMTDAERIEMGKAGQDWLYKHNMVEQHMSSLIMRIKNS